MEQPKNDVLKVKRLHVEFQTSHGMVHAVKDVSLEVKRGRIHALVGESGSGKSVTSLTIMNLLAGNGKVISGDVTLNGKSLLKLSGKEKRQLYGDRIGMIFQDPTAALDPLFTGEQLLLEGLRKHRRMSKKQAREAALESLRMMNLRDPEELMKKKPENIQSGTDLILLCKKLERFADHILHLVFDLIYILKGENMRKIELLEERKI